MAEDLQQPVVGLQGIAVAVGLREGQLGQEPRVAGDELIELALLLPSRTDDTLTGLQHQLVQVASELHLRILAVLVV